jgi:hypothetical protein
MTAHLAAACAARDTLLSGDTKAPPGEFITTAGELMSV